MTTSPSANDHPVVTYVAARKTYEDCFGRVATYLAALDAVAKAIQHEPDAFLHFNCGVPKIYTDGERLLDVEKIAFKAEAWPSWAELTVAVAEVDRAFEVVTAAYHAVSEADRVGLSRLPKTVMAFQLRRGDY